MEDTAMFRKALNEGRLDEAEAFLDAVAHLPEHFPQYDASWLDQRQRELFQAYYKVEDWYGAKRVVEATVDPRSKDGRIARLEELSGMSYVEI